LREVDRLVAAITGMAAIELIRKDFFLGTATRALAGKRLEVAKIGKPGAMLGRSRHVFLLGMISYLKNVGGA
jgi:hypothetical protein